MGVKQKKNASLASVLRVVCLKPPHKFHSGLISDVYSRVKSPQNLNDLLASKYFERVLWKFFHPDISNSHLELLLEVAAYEYDQYALCKCLDLIRKEPSKASQLMLRLLVSTLTSTESNSRIEAKLFIFLRSVLIVCPDLLLNSSVYPKWRDAIMLRYSKSIVVEPVRLGHFEVIQCFLMFCMSCVASKTELGAIISTLSIPTFFRSADNGLVRWLAELLLLMIVKPEQDLFTKLQIALKSTNTDTSVPSAFLAPLEYDVDSETFVEELQMLPEPTIESIASAIGYTGPKVPRNVMVQIIFGISLGSRITELHLQELLESTEETLFDIFETNSLVSHFPAPLIPYNHGEPIDQQISCRRTHDLRKSIYDIAASSLKRLEIIDPSSAQGIKGSSKYFSLLGRIVSKGSRISVADINEKFRSGITEDDYVLLLELQKPNKFGGLDRVAKHGLVSCRLGRVTKNEKNLEIYRSLPELDDRLNAIISLSSLSLGCALTTNQSQLFKQLLARFEQEATTKEKESYTKGSILESMLNNTYTKLQDFSKIEAELYTSEFLQHFEKEMQAGSVVCVVPTKSAVDIYPLSPNWIDKTFKFDSFNESLIRAIARINAGLTQVSMLADRLNLSEYDFDGSIRNALMLYECHIVPKWKSFASTFSETKYNHYPFGEISSKSFEDTKTEVATHYFEICRLFSTLQELIYFDKFNLSNLKTKDKEQLNKDLIKRAKLFVVLYADVDKVPVEVESIITTNLIYFPYVNNLKRFIVTGPTNFQIPETIKFSEELKCGRKSLKNVVPGFVHSYQKVKVPPTDQQVNIEEATYCLLIYHYMRLLGFSHNHILIVCASPFTKLLLGELHEEFSKSGLNVKQPIIQMAEEFFPCDFVIVSSHGGLSTAHYFDLMTNKKMGFVIVGADNAEPYELFSGRLALLPNESYGDFGDRQDLSLIEIKDSRHMDNLVRELEKDRRE